jgi:hypothetical protein
LHDFSGGNRDSSHILLRNAPAKGDITLKGKYSRGIKEAQIALSKIVALGSHNHNTKATTWYNEGQNWHIFLFGGREESKFNGNV